MDTEWWTHGDMSWWCHGHGHVIGIYNGYRGEAFIIYDGIAYIYMYNTLYVIIYIYK